MVNPFKINHTCHSNTNMNMANTLILIISNIYLFVGIYLVVNGSIRALVPLFVTVLGFAYVNRNNQSNRWLDAHNTTFTEPEETLTILRQRYARGEIDHAEFESRLDDLLETETVEQVVNYRDETPITERSQ